MRMAWQRKAGILRGAKPPGSKAKAEQETAPAWSLNGSRETGYLTAANQYLASVEQPQQA